MSKADRPRRWLSLAALAVLLLAALAVVQGARNLGQAQARLDRLRAANAKLDQENRRLYRRVSRLRSDPRALERTCRHEMGLVRPDEVVYR